MEKQQRRGIRFPTYPLSEALRLVRMVQDQGAGRLSTNATAVALDLSPNSSSFLSRVAAAKHFALVEDNEGILITTALAKRILRPTTANQEKEGLSEAFLNFQVTEYGISDVSKDMAYNIFVESGKSSGKIIDTGKGLLVGVQEIPQVETVSEARTIPPRLDGRLVQLLIDIGALRTALEISCISVEETPGKIESMSRGLLEKTLALARELELPATKISLKVVSDQLNSSGLDDASQFAPYVEEGLRDDLSRREYKT